MLAQRETPPGPPPRRGGLLDSARYAYHFITDPIGFVGGRFARYGDIYYAPSRGTGLYVIKHPDHLREVLATRSHDWAKSHSAFEKMSMVLGSGLLTSDGDGWKRHRRMIQPAFVRGRLERYAEVMVAEARRTSASWRPGQLVHIDREMMALTLRVVSRTLFGHDVRGDIDVIAGAMRRFQSSILSLDITPAWLPSPGRRRFERALADLDALSYRLIDARRPGDAHDDLLQRLVDAVDDEGDGGRLTRREVRDELVTLFLAGHETTSVALTWTWRLLAENPAARATLEEELDRVLGARSPAHEDIDDLPWTGQVLDEAMRLYPPAFMVARRARTDTAIGRWKVPAGSEVACWIYMTHRDPRWYPEPERFQPERLSPEARAALPKMAYLPFGGGPRACIGAQFALLEARLILAELARRWRVEPAWRREVAPRPRITLAPSRPVPMRVVPRQARS